MCWNELIFSMFNKLKEQETHKLTIPFENLKELSNYDQTAKERFFKSNSYLIIKLKTTKIWN